MATASLLAITGSQRPYLFDLPHLLSLPEGFEFRFRYRPSWIERSLVDSCPPGDPSFSGEDVIILFHSQESRTIIPVRKARVIDLERVGPMLLLRFRVGPFINIALDLDTYSYAKTGDGAQDSSLKSALQKLSKHATRLLGPVEGNPAYDLGKPLPNGWHLRRAATESDDTDWDQGDASAAWAKVVAVLHNDPSLIGVPFFFLLGFRAESGATIKPSTVKNRFSPTKEKIHGFTLEEAERYRMRILEWCERPRTEPAPLVRLSCEFSDQHLALEGKSNLVVGRYDVVEFTFSARQAGYCEVGLSAESLKEPVEPETDKMRAWSDWPTIFVARVPVVVSAKTRKVVLLMLVAVGGGYLYLGVAPPLVVQSPAMASFLQLLGLAAMLPFADHLKKFFELRGNFGKLSGAPKG